jgi:hypothetical protein
MTELTRENYTRVTTVLNPFSGLDKVDPKVLSHAAERGTKVHKICEGIMAGLGEFGVDDETAGYVESFKKWWGEGRYVLSIERRFYCDELQLTGQIDLIYVNGGGECCILDLKTSSRVSPTWRAQGCAYAYLAQTNGIDVHRVQFLHLRRDGRDPTLIEYDPEPEFFAEVFRVYKHFFSKEKYDRAKPCVSSETGCVERKEAQGT